MRGENSYNRVRQNEMNNYILMYNNNIAQINNLYSMNAILQNNINLIQNNQHQYRHRARRHHPPHLVVPSSPIDNSVQVQGQEQGQEQGQGQGELHMARPLLNARAPPLRHLTREPPSAPQLPPPPPPRVRSRRQTFFDPVIIYPTQSQIENATRFVQYDTITNPSNETCPFTCEAFTNQDMVRQILYCGHICSSVGFNTWFASNISCPICRYDIRNYQPTRLFNNEQLVSSIPSPPSTSTTPNTTPTPTTTPSSENLNTLIDDAAEVMIRNYLDFFYDTQNQPNNNDTQTSSTPSNDETRINQNIVYYTIRNIER